VSSSRASAASVASRGACPSRGGRCRSRLTLGKNQTMTSNRPTMTLRKASPEDANEVAEIWFLGWQDGHLGFVPQELVDARTEGSFRARAAERVGDTTVATVDGAVAGFIMVVDDEVEQVYVSALHRGTGVADVLIDEAERQARANGYGKAWLAVVAANARARAFYERAGWFDEGPFDYRAAADAGPIVVPCHRYTKGL
jgi:GNAT superfamily N-acetyltransferase